MVLLLENEIIKENYALANWFWYKDSSNSVENILNKLEEPAVLGLATFIWNWKFNSTLCKEVKKMAQMFDCNWWMATTMADRSQGFLKNFHFLT